MDEELNNILTNEELDNTAKVEAVKKFVGTKYVPQERYNTLKEKSASELEQVKTEFDAYKTSKMTDEEKQLAEAQAKEEELKNANRTISRLYAENIFKGAGLQEADYSGIIDNIQDLPQEKVKELASELGYAANMKDYKKDPDNYKGNVADIATVLRVALTSKSKTPDLCEIMCILGKDRIEKRYRKFYKD